MAEYNWMYSEELAQVYKCNLCGAPSISEDEARTHLVRDHNVTAAKLPHSYKKEVKV